MFAAEDLEDAVYNSKSEGLRLRLRVVEKSDASYIFRLRVNPLYNRHLSAVRGTVEDQRLWIEAYKAREAAGQELYFAIERKDGRLCGLVRLYDIGQSSFTWGSWILDTNKPPKAALESALLSFEVGFEKLDIPVALVDVRVSNEKALSFYKRLGMTELHRDFCNVYFEYSREKFRTDRDALVKILQQVTEA